jgi:hypothetical protein
MSDSVSKFINMIANIKCDKHSSYIAIKDIRKKANDLIKQLPTVDDKQEVKEIENCACGGSFDVYEIEYRCNKCYDIVLDSTR